MTSYELGTGAYPVQLAGLLLVMGNDCPTKMRFLRIKLNTLSTTTKYYCLLYYFIFLFIAPHINLSLKTSCLKSAFKMYFFRSLRFVYPLNCIECTSASGIASERMPRFQYSFFYREVCVLNF